jgi:ATP-dependent helicase/nuclease subunit B
LKTVRFTDVERLIRDPYAIYARRILGLEALDAPGRVAGPAERGTAIHAALEHHQSNEDVDALLARLDAALDAAGFSRERRRTERMRLKASAEAFVRWNAAREAGGYQIFREIVGRDDLGGGRTLTGRADRIDVRPDGLADVIDYKTGAPPTARQVNSGLSPQLTLEAAVLARGGFDKEGLARARTAALVYWRFGGRDPGAVEIVTDEEVNAFAHETLERLRALLLRYGDPAQPFFSKPRVQFANTWDEYDHFARRAEWADVAGDGE